MIIYNSKIRIRLLLVFESFDKLQCPVFKMAYFGKEFVLQKQENFDGFIDSLQLGTYHKVYQYLGNFRLLLTSFSFKGSMWRKNEYKRLNPNDPGTLLFGLFKLQFLIFLSKRPMLYSFDSVSGYMLAVTGAPDGMDRLSWGYVSGTLFIHIVHITLTSKVTSLKILINQFLTGFMYHRAKSTNI